MGFPPHVQSRDPLAEHTDRLVGDTCTGHSENREGAATLQAQGRNPKTEASALWQNFPMSLFQKDFQSNVSR